MANLKEDAAVQSPFSQTSGFEKQQMNRTFFSPPPPKPLLTSPELLFVGDLTKVKKRRVERFMTQRLRVKSNV
jgi:hypothetical protein